MFVVDVGRVDMNRVIDLIPMAVEGGLSMVMLRDKHSDEQQALIHAQRIRAVTPSHVPFLVNGRVEVALASKADGIHLPESGPSVDAIRQTIPEGWWVGRSVHSVEAAQETAAEGVDYLLVGTMFATSSKPGKVPEGPTLLHNIAGLTRVPLLGIGGITDSNAGLVWASGASGVAVVTSLARTHDPAGYVRELRYRSIL